MFASTEQAFNYARSKAGDVTELFDVLAGKLRPDRAGQGESEGLGGTSLSSKSVLKAQYHGSSGSTVLGMANLKRIQTFLDEPQRHLGQVNSGLYTQFADKVRCTYRWSDRDSGDNSWCCMVASLNAEPGGAANRPKATTVHSEFSKPKYL